ncbi:MAG TPA: hypothetical protein VFC07_10595, partial [Verrucomicrobiae bacterium]|nr:hypothetical protein [Verrucomicrobiae bacterium]
MKPNYSIYLVRKGASGGITLFCVLGIAPALHAQQQVLAPPPLYSVAPPAVQEYETNQIGAPQVESLATSAGT